MSSASGRLLRATCTDAKSLRLPGGREPGHDRQEVHGTDTICAGTLYAQGHTMAAHDAAAQHADGLTKLNAALGNLRKWCSSPWAQLVEQRPV